MSSGDSLADRALTAATVGGVGAKADAAASVMAATKLMHAFQPLVGCDEDAKLLGNIHVKTLQRYARRADNRCWLKNYIRPKWGEYPIDQIKPLAVEQWLKGLDLGPKSKGHLKNQMRILFNCAMRWELLPYQSNPMGLVRVKDSSKRVRVPAVLTIEQFREVLLHIPEPYRMMCVVAGCLGLRISEVLGLQWCDFDWKNQQVQIRRSRVYGHVGEPKTENSRRPMPLDLALEKLLRDHRYRLPPMLQESAWVFPNAREYLHILGLHSVAACSVQEKRSEWEDWAGMHFGTPIRLSSTSTEQT